MLPSGYTQLEYIQSSGTQYINTSFVPNFETRIIMDCEIISHPSNASFFGARAAAAGNDITSNTLVIMAEGYIRSDYYGSSVNNSSIPSGRITIDRSSNVTTFSTTTLRNTVSSRSSNDTLYLFATNTNGASSLPGRIRLYSCKIYDGETLTRDYVPCRNSSGSVGLYDIVNNTFYNNQGSGTFASGPIVPSVFKEIQYIQSSGSQYIDTGFKPNQNTRVLMDVQCMSNGTYPFYGSRISASGQAYGLWKISDTSLRYDYGTGRASANTSNTNVRVLIDSNKNVCEFRDTTLTNTSRTFSVSYNLLILAFNTANEVDERMMSARLYSFSIYDNGVLVRDFTPVETGEGEVGLYDNVEGRFYRNSGTGVFVAGPYVAPDPPTNLTGFVSNKTVYLSWNASPSEDLTGYKVYIDGDLVGTTTSLSYAHAITPGENHAVSVSSYSENGESDQVSISVYYELPNPPTNLDATFDEGIIHLLWTDSTTEDVTDYRIYQNGVLVTTTPAVFSLFEFPFSNESLTENLLELSSLERVQFYQSIDPYTNYTFSVTAFNEYGESDPVSISIYYETTPDVTSVSLIPNPVFTGESLTISVSVGQLYDVTIT